MVIITHHYDQPLVYSVPRWLISRHTAIHGRSVLRDTPIHIGFGEIPAQNLNMWSDNVQYICT